MNKSSLIDLITDYTMLSAKLQTGKEKRGCVNSLSDCK